MRAASAARRRPPPRRPTRRRGPPWICPCWQPCCCRGGRPPRPAWAAPCAPQCPPGRVPTSVLARKQAHTLTFSTMPNAMCRCASRAAAHHGLVAARAQLDVVHRNDGPLGMPGAGIEMSVRPGLGCRVRPRQRGGMVRPGTHRAKSSTSRAVASSCLYATSVRAAINCFEQPSPFFCATGARRGPFAAHRRRPSAHAL